MIDFQMDDKSAEVLRALERQLAEAYADIGQKAVQHAKRALTAAGRVETGALRDSIKYAVRKNTVWIGTNNAYAPHHELGTGHYNSKHRSASYGVRPLHFLQQAASRHMDEYRRLLERRLKT